GEGNEENIFVDTATFEAKRPDFLFTFQTFPTYEYGIEAPSPLSEKELRMRILMPVHARIFRELVSEPSIFCSISPFQANPFAIFETREAVADPRDIRARERRFHIDKAEADSVADI